MYKLPETKTSKLILRLPLFQFLNEVLEKGGFCSEAFFFLHMYMVVLNLCFIFFGRTCTFWRPGVSLISFSTAEPDINKLTERKRLLVFFNIFKKLFLKFEAWFYK